MTDNVVRLYSRVAGVYDAWTFFTESRSLRWALDSAAIRDGESVLEVAVGTGVTFRDILHRNARGRNVGIDLTEAMLHRARRKAEESGANFELLQADARSLPFPDATFDVVVNTNMLGVVPESMFDAILSEMFRVLRPSGRLVIVTMMRPSSRLSTMVYRIGAVWLGGWRDVDIQPFVHRAGFEAIRRHTVTQLGIPSEILSATRK